MQEKAVAIYSASAGAGKTYTLAKKYIEMLLEKHSGSNGHRHILAVTFTKKATAEMKERILTNLYELAYGFSSDFLCEKEDDPNNFKAYCKGIGLDSEEAIRSRAKTVLHELLQDYSMFAVSTIDSFFQQIIRSFAKEIGLHCGYNLEMDSDQVIGKAIDDVFFNLQEGTPIYKWMLDYVSELLDENGKWNNKDEIKNLCKDLIKENFQSQVSSIVMNYTTEQLKEYKGQLKRYIKDFREQALDLIKKGREIANKHGLCSKKDVKNNTLNPIWDDNIKEPNDTFMKVAQVEDLISGGKDAGAIRSAWDAGLGDTIIRLQDHWIKNFKTYSTCSSILSHLNALGTMPAIQAQIEDSNRDLHRMPISETNRRLRSIIGNSDTPFIYEKVGQRITHFLLDEFQDTSTLQWANFSPLIKESIATCADDKATDLIVGDIKQSIYRWRNSDWRLLYQGIENDLWDRCEKKSLTINFRSSHDIVAFNNCFFARYTNCVVGMCEREADKKTIADIYYDLEQQAKKTDEPGAVKISFLGKEAFADPDLGHVIEAIRDLENRGLKGHLSKIGILIRNNKDAKKIATALSAAGIGVTSKEGLQIENGLSVKLLVAQLQVFNKPKDKKVLFERNHVYSLYKKLSTEERLALLIKSPEEALRELDEQLAVHKTKPLYQMVQDVAIALDMYTEENAADQGYLQAFMDEVYKYCSNKDADLFSFLEWWKEHHEKLFIPIPDEENSVQMMTIHQSKGLEFDAVIIPYCNWLIDIDKHHYPIFWCDTHQNATIGSIPIVPISMTASMGNSLFREEYLDEKFNQFVDNINLTYVAFTRPRKELIIFAEKPTKNDISNIGDLLYQTYKDGCKKDIYIEGTIKVDKEQKDEPGWAEFTYSEEVKKTVKNGKPVYQKTPAKVEKIDCLAPVYHPITIRQHYDDTDPIKEGKELHDILSRIKTENDLEQALKDAKNEGIISTEKVAQKRQEILDLFAFVKANGYNWFDDVWEVKNEIEFIKYGTENVGDETRDVSGNILRADRVLFSENEIIVIDYKSGFKKQDEHVSQVQEYMSLLAEMRPEETIRGYLLYTTIKVIKPVENAKR